MWIVTQKQINNSYALKALRMLLMVSLQLFPLNAYVFATGACYRWVIRPKLLEGVGSHLKKIIIHMRYDNSDLLDGISSAISTEHNASGLCLRQSCMLL